MKYNVSEINAVIRNRRTIKPERFSKREVHREIVEALLENARWAPTHGMTQPWFFKVFTGLGLKKLADFQSSKYREITEEGQFKPSKFNKMETRPLLASVVIAICMKRQESGKIPEIEEVEAVACSVQNMQLTATAYGIGSYWSSGGLTYTEEMKRFLGLSKTDKCLGFLYLGYPEDEWPTSQRKPMDYFTEWVME